MIRKSEREALKERRRSGEFKQDKKDARAAGLSRGEARRRAKRLSRVQALSKRKVMRAEMAAEKRADKMKFDLAADASRMKARRGGQKLAYDVKSAASPAKQREMAPGGTPTKKLIGSEKVTFDKAKGMFKIVSADGYVRYSQSKPAMYGAKVKPVKKAKIGGKITDPPTKKKTKAGQLNPPSSSDKNMKKTVRDVPKTNNFLGLDPGPSRPSKSKTSEYIALTSNPPKYRNLKTGKVISESEYYKVTGKIKKEGGLRKLKHGGALKSVPSKAKGLSKLPTSVRNNMGYMEDGGRLKRLKKKAHKKLTKGYNLTEKVEDSKRGENLLTGKAVKPMSEKKMDRLRKRASKKNRKGFAALKKIKTLKE